MGMKARPKGRRLYAVLSGGEVTLYSKKPKRKVAEYENYEFNSSGMWAKTGEVTKEINFDPQRDDKVANTFDTMCYNGWREAGMPALKPDTITKIYVNKGE